MEIPKTLTGTKLAVAIITLATLGVCWRLIPHAPNFAPIGAIALTAGVYLSKKHATLLLFGVMLATDTILGFYAGFEWTWLGLALIVPLGKGLERLPFAAKATIGSLSASIIFYVISNFGVWLASGMYAPTPAGLIECYIAALPFFGTTLASDFAFSSILLGLAASMRLVYPNVFRIPRLQSDS